MAAQYDDNEKTVNLILASVLILLICAVIGAMGYFSYALGILTPPGASDAPGRIGSGGGGTGVAAPGGAESAEEEVGDIIFPGFVNFSIADSGDTVELKNDGTNPVYLRFTLTDSNGKALYASDSVQPGASETWRVTDSFDPGTGKHAVTVTIDAYRLTDDSQCNGVRSTFTVDMG